MMRRVIRDNTELMKTGQDLVIGGYFGLSGILEIVNRKEEELKTYYSSDYLIRIKDLEQYVTPMEEYRWAELGATEWEEADNGGILAALWRLSGAYETGIECDLTQFPVLQEVIEVCEYYNLNPYRLQSKNCWLFAAEYGGDLVRELEKLHIPGAVIGKVSGGVKRLIHNGEIRTFLDRPTKDELLKIY